MALITDLMLHLGAGIDIVNSIDELTLTEIECLLLSFGIITPFYYYYY